MDIKRILFLAGILTEAMIFSVDMEEEVERRIKDFPPEMQTLMLDAVEILRAAGPLGLPARPWADNMKAMHPDKTFNPAEVFRNVMQKLDCVVKRVMNPSHDELTEVPFYVFSPRANTSSDFEAEQNATADMASQQIKLGDNVMKAVTAMGSFTESDLVNLLSRMGMPSASAEEYANHFIGQFLGSVFRKEGDRYMVIKQSRPTPAETMAMFRNMAANPPETSIED